MAFPEVNEEVVYLTAGAALPAVIDDTLRSLLNDDFKTAYTKLQDVSSILCGDYFAFILFIIL
jgi:hypothetical protein